MDIPFHVPGTAVRVLDDIITVHELQTIGPGWNDDIALVGHRCVCMHAVPIPTKYQAVYMCETTLVDTI